MEKPQQQDETVSFKEYPPSEIYSSSDPPPAYIKPRHNNVVQVARIAAYTLVAVSFILGSFILASSYVTASLSCQEYQPYPQEYIEDRLPRFQSLVADPLESEETKHHQLESADHHQENKDQGEVAKDQQEKDESQPEKEEGNHQQNDDEEQEDHEFKFKLPIHLDLDALTGALMEGNSKSKMNCVVEKQKSEEVLNKDQRELITFGLDLAGLDPGLKHITGERLAIVCETSIREAPKENQVDQIVMPFPLPNLHSHIMPQRMLVQGMPHHGVHQHPMQNQAMANNPIPQTLLPRNPFNAMPFPRSQNPFQSLIQSHRSNVEEIPILVLEENDARLQNLVELPRGAHPQVQNLFELQRGNNPQVQNLLELQRGNNPQVQNLLELQRGINPQLQNLFHLQRGNNPHVQNLVHLQRGNAPPHVHNIAEFQRGAPSLQNFIDMPETKAFPVMQGMPEGRRLPPWMRPEVQEHVVQIEAMHNLMRPQPRPVQIEARPVHVESGSIQVEPRPIQVEGRPPMHMEPRPIHMEPRPMHMEPRPIQMETRPIQMEARPIQMEVRHPEGRSLPIEGRSLPIPSDTVNPPPPPFDLQPEPSRPHFVQPRSVRSVDNVLHRRDKRERRCACDCAC